MSGETEREPSGWTVDTLRVYLLEKINGNDTRYNDRFKGSDEAVKAALAAQQDATKVAGEISSKRMDGLNELRNMAEDQQKVYADYAKTYIPRGEAMAEIRSVQQNVDAAVKRIDAVTTRLDLGAGEKVGAAVTKTESRASVAMIVAMSVAASTIFGVLLNYLKQTADHVIPPSVIEQRYQTYQPPPGYVLVPTPTPK